MARATLAFHNFIAVVFDFDLTLAEGSVDQILRKLDVDPARFREEPCSRWMKKAGITRWRASRH